jgi:hypothetical protein
MPYITQNKRKEGNNPTSTGELTYKLTRACVDYVNDNPPLSSSLFDRLSEVLAALEATKLEFYRRVLVPYEKRKREENGDVYQKDPLA